MTSETIAPDIQIVGDGGTILIFGVSYDIGFFRALAARLKPGTRVEVFGRGDGKWELYTYRLPGAVPSANGS